MRRAIVTGASGFIGSRLVKAFASADWEVLQLSRRPCSKGGQWLPFDLRGGDFPVIPPADALVHAAYDFSTHDWRGIHAFNVRRSIELFEWANRHGCRQFIFVSSMAAFPESRSMYGRAKFEVEQQLLPRGAAVVRPGLVVGPGARGIVSAMERWVERLPVIPLIGSGRQRLFPCHIDDLCQALISLAASLVPTRQPLVLASSNSISLAELVRHFARKHERKVLLLPLPAEALRIGLMLGESLGLELPFRSDSVLSLAHQNPAPFEGVGRLAEVTFRDLS